MMAGADRYARAVDDGRDIVRVQAIDRERHDGALVQRTAVDLEPLELPQPSVRVGADIGLVRRDLLAADLHHVAERRAKPDGRHDRRRTCLEAMRRRRVGDAVGVHALDHLAAAHVRRHRIEMLALGIKHPDARGAVGLVAGEHVEISVEILHVDHPVHRRLAAVHQHRNAARMRQRDHFFHGHDRAQHVRHMRQGDQLGLRRQQRRELLQQELAVVGDRRPFQHHAAPLAMKMPRHDVGVMLHDRQHHFVARAQHLPAERRRNQIDRLGR